MIDSATRHLEQIGLEEGVNVQLKYIQRHCTVNHYCPTHVVGQSVTAVFHLSYILSILLLAFIVNYSLKNLL